jgi:hypothetical protein
MGSKFLLNSGESEWDGSVSELTVKNLIPGFPIKTDSNKKLISTKLELSDINGSDTLLKNPYDGNLQVQNLTTTYDTTPVDLNEFIATTINSITDNANKIQNITAIPDETTMTGLLRAPEIATDRVAAVDQSTWIEFEDNEVNFAASTVKINGEPIYSVQNIEITETDEFLELPTSTPYSTIQYNKSIQTPRNIIILFKGLQLAKLYFNRKQTVIFNKFNDTWIC